MSEGQKDFTFYFIGIMIILTIFAEEYGARDKVKQFYNRVEQCQNDYPDKSIITCCKYEYKLMKGE